MTLPGRPSHTGATAWSITADAEAQQRYLGVEPLAAS